MQNRWKTSALNLWNKQTNKLEVEYSASTCSFFSFTFLVTTQKFRIHILHSIIICSFFYFYKNQSLISDIYFSPWRFGKTTLKSRINKLNLTAVTPAQKVYIWQKYEFLDWPATSFFRISGRGWNNYGLPSKYHQCINLIIKAKWHKIGCSTLGNNIVSFQCCSIPYHGLRTPNEPFVHWNPELLGLGR